MARRWWSRTPSMRSAWPGSSAAQTRRSVRPRPPCSSRRPTGTPARSAAPRGRWGSGRRRRRGSNAGRIRRALPWPRIGRPPCSGSGAAGWDCAGWSTSTPGASGGRRSACATRGRRRCWASTSPRTRWCGSYDRWDARSPMAPRCGSARPHSGPTSCARRTSSRKWPGSTDTTPGTLVPALLKDARIRETLARSGLTEVLTLTLEPAEVAAQGGIPPVALQNPLVADQAALRTSLLPGLLDVLSGNANRRVEDVQVFELGRVFRAAPRARPVEQRSLGIAVMGRWRTGWNISIDQAAADFFYLKGILEALPRDLGVREWQEEPLAPPDPWADSERPWWHPARAAVLTVAGRVVGRFGELHADLGAARRLPHRAYVAEVDLEALLPMVVLVGTAPELPRYPAVERDIAVVSPDHLPAAAIEAAIRAGAGPLLEALDLFDVYAGPPIPSGHRNLAYRLRLRDRDRTLTADEAEEIIQRVRIGLQEKAGVQLRE